MLELMATALRKLLAGCAEPLDILTVGKIQGDLGPAMARLEIIADEARRERMPYFSADPDLKPLLRILLRLRHDLVIIGRTAVAPLPDGFRARLATSIVAVSVSAAAFLEECAAALLGDAAPSLANLEAALQSYETEIAALRQEGLTRNLPTEAMERLFGLGFALEQLHQDMKELSRWIADLSLLDAAE
jgi:hypothetical protein